MRLINRIRARLDLEYYEEHLLVSILISAVAVILLMWQDSPYVLQGLVAGPAWYAVREFNQWFSYGRYRWPTWLDWLLGEPSRTFDKPGFWWPQIPLAVYVVIRVVMVAVIYYITG